MLRVSLSEVCCVNSSIGGFRGENVVYDRTWCDFVSGKIRETYLGRIDAFFNSFEKSARKHVQAHRAGNVLGLDFVNNASKSLLVYSGPAYY